MLLSWLPRNWWNVYVWKQKEVGYAGLKFTRGRKVVELAFLSSTIQRRGKVCFLFLGRAFSCTDFFPWCLGILIRRKKTESGTFFSGPRKLTSLEAPFFAFHHVTRTQKQDYLVGACWDFLPFRTYKSWKETWSWAVPSLRLDRNLLTEPINASLLLLLSNFSGRSIWQMLRPGNWQSTTTNLVCFCRLMPAFLEFLTLPLSRVYM